MQGKVEGETAAVALFGPYRFNLVTLELTKNGLTLAIEEQPAQALKLLVERSGELVSRDDLRRLLWPHGIYVDYEHGVHKSINKLRTVLGDDPNNPQFVATLRGRGYRFIAPVELNLAAKTDALACPENENGNPRVPPSQPRLARIRNRRAVTAVTALFLVMAVITGAVLFRSSRNIGFNARDWVLVAAFENRTGEPLFDGTLQYAIERELSNSRFVNIVPRERVEEVLRMMKRPADTSIDVALAREICLRDGGIRAVLTGRAEKLGPTYVFSVLLIQPKDGTTVQAASEHADGESQVWPAVRRLSNWVRQTLGEGLASIAQSNAQLEKVTTPSLRALQLYSEGLRIGSDELLRQAIQEYPDFAMAHMMLSLFLWNSGHDWRFETERARQLSRGASERERLFIEGGYYQQLGELEKSAKFFQALLAIYPDDTQARGSLGEIMMNLGRSPEIVLNAGRIRPIDYPFLIRAAVYRASAAQDLAGARRYIEQARQVEDPADPDGYVVTFFPVHEYWLQDDPVSGLRELGRISASMTLPHQNDLADDLAELVGQFYLAFGKVQIAEEWFRKITGVPAKVRMLALAAYLKGDQRDERKYISEFRESSDGPCGICSILHSRMGPDTDPDESLVLLHRITNSKIQAFRFTHRLAEGDYALAHGETATAIALLRQGVAENRQYGSPWYFLGQESLANALEKHGEPDEALRVLEQASRDRLVNIHTMYSIYGVFWLRIQAHLAKRYREMGKMDNSRKIEEQLRRLLAYADPEFSIVRQLRNKTASF